MRLAVPSVACAARSSPLRGRCAAAARQAGSAPRRSPLAIPAQRRSYRATRVALRAAAAPPPADENEDDDFFKANDALVRSAPVYAGGVGIVSLLLNRVLSGGALVTDASSTQSRADVVVLAMATAALLTVRRGRRGPRSQRVLPR